MSQSPQHRDDKGTGAQPRADAAPAKRARLRDRKITITLTLPQTFFGLFFAIFILVWVFIFGVMLGRGHNPEEVVPPLADMMPNREVPAYLPDEEHVDAVIPPQDLGYHDTLKSKDPERPKPVQGQPRGTQAPAKPQSQPQPPAARKPAVAKPAEATKTEPDRTVYNYVYQVAAVNNSAGAQAMQKKLRDSGFAASVSQSESNGVTWYRVMVSFKGTPEDTRTLKAKLAPHGISAIILRGKTPVQ